MARHSSWQPGDLGGRAGVVSVGLVLWLALIFVTRPIVAGPKNLVGSPNESDLCWRLTRVVDLVRERQPKWRLPRIIARPCLVQVVSDVQFLDIEVRPMRKSHRQASGVGGSLRLAGLPANDDQGPFRRRIAIWRLLISSACFLAAVGVLVRGGSLFGYGVLLGAGFAVLFMR